MHCKLSIFTALSLGATAIAAPASTSSAEDAPPSSSEVPYIRTWSPPLPPNVEKITNFGERPVWSPDGKRLAFMSKTYGEALELDLFTHQLKVLVTQPSYPGFMRVHYLPNNDLVLIGARTFESSLKTRFEDQELWVLPQGEDKPTALDRKVFEGVAVSKLSNKIAWAASFEQYPDRFGDEEGSLFVADIDYTADGTPKITNEREVFKGVPRVCMPEAQDFRNNDTELIFSCYVRPEGADVTTESASDVFGVHLESGETTRYRQVEGEYNEAEGLYPNNKYVLVESAKDSPTGVTVGGDFIDIYRMSLEPDSKDMVRITNFTETPGWKASNAVVSPDGLAISFQAGRAGDLPGQGRGLYIIQLDSEEEKQLGEKEMHGSD